MPDVFLTGGSGFVGGAVLRRFVAEGRSVRALARSDRAAEAVAAHGAEPARGDLHDGEALTAGIEGCDVVVHVGGLNENCLADTRPLYRANVDGTRAVVEAAGRVGARRVVVTSSAAAIGEPTGTVATEATEHRGTFMTHYERSKYLGERVALAEGERLGLEVVVVNPSSVQGPGRTGGTAKILLAFLRGKLRYAVDTRLSLVSIGDTAEAHVLAADHGVPGERYIVSGATLTLREALALLGEVTGEDHGVRFLPGRPVMAAATIVGGAFRMVRRQAPVCREIVRIMLHGPAYDGSKITRELGLSYTPLREWVGETVAWYRTEGLV
ncbi:MAG TPA: NAD-dependent epimerase/dehydratase family protein [Acidimicrobiia bacterium]|nr:NAD-dependent epimerase/dehydratase family protein [Acidimicrobiia bacterium]